MQPEKFSGTGINELDGYSPAEWPQATEFVDSVISSQREQAMVGIESIPLTERQLFAIQSVALPAITDTLTGILGNEAAIGLIGNTFLSYLTAQNFDSCYGGANSAAGVYFAERNHSAIRESAARSDSPEGLAYFTKVFVHEYFHYLSHQSSSLQDNQLHIKRIGVDTLADDIREANEGIPTWDYFLSYNEAITEQLTIETLQKITSDIFMGEHGVTVGFYKTYPQYRDLLGKVMDDAIRYGATSLARPDLWRSICRGYLTGEMRPLIRLIHTTYPGIRAKEFGLMTHVDDLPHAGEFITVPPDDRFPPRRPYRVSTDYLDRLHARLNGKTNQDYVHDLGLPPPPPPPAGAVARRHRETIADHQEQKTLFLNVVRRSDGMFVDEQGTIRYRDENDNLIHYDQAWLKDLLPLLYSVCIRLREGAITQREAEVEIDQTLFEQRHISELSDGFDEFYVIKHVVLDPTTSAKKFNTYLRKINDKFRELQGRSRSNPV